MAGLETIEKYHEAKHTLDELYDVCDWVADKLGPLYISGHDYYEFDIEKCCRKLPAFRLV